MSKSSKISTNRETAKKSPGRPSNYSQKVAQEICKRLGNGESLRRICTSPGMPSKTSVMRWLDVNLEFREQYARAREMQAEHWAEEILEIADDSRNDFIEKDGRPALNAENINRSRLRVDTRKWLMSKLLPKKFGDKITTAVVGDPENPTPQHEVIVTFVAAKDGKPA